MARKQRNSEWHYHIRWLPSDVLDWQPFSKLETAERQAKRLVGNEETYTIERFSGECGRCRSRQYSEPTEARRQANFLN